LFGAPAFALPLLAAEERQSVLAGCGLSSSEVD
jgi:hypothetical protein